MTLEDTVGRGHLYCVSLQTNIVMQNQPELPAALKGTLIFASIRRANFTVIFIATTLLISPHNS